MSNLLNEQYMAWLKQYIHYCDHPTILKIAAELIEVLPKIKDIRDLRRVLSKFINPQGDKVQLQQTTLYGPINFYIQLLTWQSELETIENTKPKAFRVVRSIVETSETKPLIVFLSAVLSKPKMQLHYKMPNLLTLLCAKNFPEILNFIISLSKTPLPESTKLKSYPLVSPDIPIHKDLLILLHKVSIQARNKNELGIQADRLLQSALAIYQEMQLVEVSLNESVEHQIERAPDECVIL